MKWQAQVKACGSVVLLLFSYLKRGEQKSRGGERGGDERGGREMTDCAVQLPLLEQLHGTSVHVVAGAMRQTAVTGSLDSKTKLSVHPPRLDPTQSSFSTHCPKLLEVIMNS